MASRKKKPAEVPAAFPSYKDWREQRLAQMALHGHKDGLSSQEIDRELRAVPNTELRAEYDAEKAATVAVETRTHLRIRDFLTRPSSFWRSLCYPGG